MTRTDRSRNVGVFFTFKSLNYILSVGGTDGWLVKTGTTRPGVDCGGTQPKSWQTTPPPKPVCNDWFGCGCQGGGEGALPTFAIAWGVGFLVFRRRRTKA